MRKGFNAIKSRKIGAILFLVSLLTFAIANLGLEPNFTNANQLQDQAEEIKKVAPNFNQALSESQNWTELSANWLESGSSFKYFKVKNTQDIKALSQKFQEIEKSSKLSFIAVKSLPKNQLKFLMALAPKLKGDRRFIKMHEAIASISSKADKKETPNQNLGILIFLFTSITISYICFINRQKIFTIIKSRRSNLPPTVILKNGSLGKNELTSTADLETPEWLQEWEAENYDSGFRAESRIPTLLDQEIPEEVQTLAKKAADAILSTLKIGDQNSIFLCDVTNEYVPINFQNIAYFYYDLFCQLNEKIDIYDSQKHIKKKLVGVGLSSSLLKIEFLEFELASQKFNSSTTTLNLNPFNLSLDTQLLQISSWLIFLSQEMSNFTIIKSTPLSTPIVSTSINIKSDRPLWQKINNLQISLQQNLPNVTQEFKIEKSQEFFREHKLQRSQDQQVQKLILTARKLAAKNCEIWHTGHQTQSSYAREPSEYLDLEPNNFDAFRYEMLKTKNLKLSPENAQSTLMSYRQFFAPQAFYQVLTQADFCFNKI
jgi:hypothetical protein